MSRQAKDSNGNWYLVSGETDSNFMGTLAQWNALSASEKVRYKTIDITDDFNGMAIDSTPTDNSVNPVQSGGTYTALAGKANTTDVNNMHKVTTFEVDTTDWVEDTTSQSGSTLYKKTITLNNVYTDSIGIDIGTATGYTLPTVDEQTAYDLIQYATVDSAVPALYLYTSAEPGDTFYINVEGVD